MCDIFAAAGETDHVTVKLYSIGAAVLNSDKETGMDYSAVGRPRTLGHILMNLHQCWQYRKARTPTV